MSLVGVVTAVTSATTATNVTVADESSDTTCFPLFVTGATGGLAPKSGSNLIFNSSTGLLQATQLGTTDLTLNNTNGQANDVDGTKGHWTIQEGENDLFIMSKIPVLYEEGDVIPEDSSIGDQKMDEEGQPIFKINKKYKFSLEEIE